MPPRPDILQFDEIEEVVQLIRASAETDNA
jgi:hypothetical protein